MTKRFGEVSPSHIEWAPFPGDELEGNRPRRLCSACREQLNRRLWGGITSRSRAAKAVQPICFQCYRADLEHQKALHAAGELDTASAERFQHLLPLEPVKAPRLSMLKVERAKVRAAAKVGVARFVDRRRRGQIEARHALEALATGLRRRELPAEERYTLGTSAVHAAELQFPSSWLPFVLAR
jgi:hypothetical protein